MKKTVDTIVQHFETLTPARVALLGQLYTEDARFKDPFNEVQGRAEIEQIFHHMYRSVQAPHFIITNRLVQAQECFLSWEFHFAFGRFQPGIKQVIRGASHLQLDATGRISMHRDYWDAAEELYEKLPLLGSLMRWLKKRARA